MSALPICCITGRIAGDPNACGDCDPCGAAHTVPDQVKKLFKERDHWGDEYAGAMMERDELRAALTAIDDICYEGDPVKTIAREALNQQLMGASK